MSTSDRVLNAAYTNSLRDLNRAESDGTDEKNVRSMYEYAPYPDLNEGLKSLDLYLRPIRDFISKTPNINFLDVGCGTGHYAVGAAATHPQWKVYGIDLSDASLSIAKNLKEKHHATNIEFHRGSYLESLPFEENKFHIINALGTIHHTSDPLGAMKNLRNYLADDGYLLLHLYGYRCDQGKFDLKEVLSILEPQFNNYPAKFALYRDLMTHQKNRWLKRLLMTSPYDVYVKARTYFRNLKRKAKGLVWSPGWREDYKQLNSPWIDHFCHPCERAYEVPHVKELVEASGFRVEHMLKQGKVNWNLMPPSWRPIYDKLDPWSQWRINELLATGGGSFAMVLKKAPKG